MSTDLSISIIIPIWNESACLPQELETIRSYIGAHFDDFELIIVESGSDDGSAELCDAYAAEHENVQVIHEGSRNGFGSALRLGYSAATKDLAMQVTVDLPFPLEKIIEAVPLFEEYDTVLSYRCADDRAWFRKIQSIFYNNLAKILLGVRVTHINSTFKLFRRSVIQSLDIRQNGWMYDAEVVYKLHQMGVRCTELPVPLIDRVTGESSISPMTPFVMFWELFKFSYSVRTS